MSLRARTIYYATPPEEYFWRWSATFDAVEWRNGKTCSLWAELQPILSYFSKNGGLPPLGSLILILAACREEWKEWEPELSDWLSGVQGEEESPEKSQWMLRHLSDGLHLVHQLPADLRKSFAAKCLLISFIFETSSQRLSPEESEATLNELSELGPSCLQWSQPDLTGIARFYRDAKGIKSGLEHETVESLEDTLRTGIDLGDITEPELVLEIEEDRTGGTLFEQLQKQQGDFAILSSIAERAIAMIHFPGALQQPDELPVGGVSDITNRGSIERLLPAELAWDDLTLAVRLVHGEALYFRREIPPQESPRQSAIFLDRGLRIWGASRLLTTGLALGITQQPRWQTGGLEVYSTAFSGWVSLDISTVDAIRSLLADLVPLAGPEDSLRGWWRLHEEEVTGDLIFITIPEHRDAPECTRLLGEISSELHGADRHLHVIAIDRDGTIEMDVWRPRGRKPGFRGKIEWEDLIRQKEEPKRKSREIVRASKDPEASYPMYRLDIPPFYFPENVTRYKTAKIADDCFVGLGLNKQIYRWHRAGAGARELVPSIPGTQHWIIHEGAQTYLVAAMEAGKPVRLFKILGGRLDEIAIEGSRHSFPREAELSGGALILAYQDFVEAFSISTGALLTNKVISKLPGNPVLRFDGEEISVLNSDSSLAKNPGETRNESWGEILRPIAVKLHDESKLLIYCDEHVFTFEFDLLRWVKIAIDRKAKKAGVENAFEPVEWEYDQGIEFATAHLPDSAEMLYDSRGILHLRSLGDDRSACLSFLLLSGKTAVWESELGLLSVDDTLLAPGSKPTGKVARQRFAKKFAEVFIKEVTQ